MILRLIIQAVVFTVILGAVLFVSAGTVYWTGAMIFLAAMQGGGLVMSLWLALKAPIC